MTRNAARGMGRWLPAGPTQPAAVLRYQDLGVAITNIKRKRLMALKTLVASLAVAGLASIVPATAAQLTVGFSQIGSESGWRAAETTVSKSEATKRGVNLKIADAQQKQENQIKAIRSFIAQNVDAIFLAPVVSSGWDAVLKEASQAKIPVILLDRDID